MKKTVEEVPCNTCVHWSKEFCLDKNGNRIARTETLSPEPFWTYELCKKNWGLPHNAYINGNTCKFYKEIVVK